jgi:hypothetical protein
MKTIIRAVVLALVVTGVAASTQISSASTKTTAVLAKTSALPTPMCAPDDPNACGLR